MNVESCRADEPRVNMGGRGDCVICAPAEPPKRTGERPTSRPHSCRRRRRRLKCPSQEAGSSGRDGTGRTRKAPARGKCRSRATELTKSICLTVRGKGTCQIPLRHRSQWCAQAPFHTWYAG